jgi:hypothetical protein
MFVNSSAVSRVPRRWLGDPERFDKGAIDWRGTESSTVQDHRSLKTRRVLVKESGKR